MYLKELTIGNLKLKNNIFLAPMAGITDKAFRTICRQYQPGLVFTEMASAKAIYYGDMRTKKLLDIQGEEPPIAVQIFGSDIEAISMATQYVTKFADSIDINMGCPAPKVVKNGDGSKLLLNLKLAKDIIKAAVEVATVPVTIKIRKGWDSDHLVAIDMAEIAEECGIAMITIHGRTREEFYTGTADWDIIRQVKEKVKIPVIGNGDIKNELDAKRMFETTGVDGIMLGRACLGNPWVFENIIQYLQQGEEYQPRKVSYEEKLQVILKQLELGIQQNGEKVAVKEMRKHIAWYLKNLPESSKIRDKVNKLETKQEIIDCLTEYFIKLRIN